MKLKEFSLVLYKGQPAIITGTDSDKIEIQTVSGSKKVREKDIDFLNDGPVKKLDTVLAATISEGNISEAYDFFTGETPSFAELSDLIWGTYPAESAWPIWKTISSSPWFVCTTPQEPITLRSRADAEAILRKAEVKREEGAERDAFKQRLLASLSGHTADGVKLPEDGKYLQDVEALALGKSDKSRSLKDANLAETPQSAHRILLATGYWQKEFNPWSSRHGHPLHSSSVPVSAPDDTTSLLDLTHLESFAIDNAWSSDPDDAVSIDGDKLWVHVADPACTVQPDTPADLDARSRGSTLYIPEGPSRMLDDSALDFFALGLSYVSRSLSFCISFTETGAISDVTIQRARIRVTRLTYAEASARREDADLAPLFAIAERNIERRRAAGAVFIDLPEIHLSVKPGSALSAGKPQIIIEPIHSELAADMVREMMLLAGEGAARFAFKNGIPFQYVSQETPEIPAELPPGLAGEYRKRRSMRSRKVGTIPADHAGLGLGMYSQVTSPLRRYGDLVAHQQLHLFLDGKKLMDTDDMLTRIASGDSASRECTFAERETNLHWILVYLSDHPEWSGDAVIVEKNGPLSTILIPEFAQESKINVDTSQELGSIIRVRAGNINIPEQTITYMPV